jgi:hypothetical protein
MVLITFVFQISQFSVPAGLNLSGPTLISRAFFLRSGAIPIARNSFSILVVLSFNAISDRLAGLYFHFSSVRNGGK